MAKQKDKRLTLMGKNMPDWVYDRLIEKSERKEMTAYITGLVEREELFNQVLSQLSNLSLLPIMSAKLDQLTMGGYVPPVQPLQPMQQEVEEPKKLEEVVPEGDIQISATVEAVGIDEDDFGSGGRDF
ncbi:hypothetical protein [Bacillus thuringiensis]|uniref:hypothetical protein n=1 Tax=Bacillus thuringiensis TaxID=1428 RepID=UPI000BFE87EC|nr:hypothetical protein [Bacillus thuringiensis]PGT90088.1 hypothetical protein COD17_10080 [Bacillus thuringiensis]